ncbi:MAG: hypothetical protein PVF73_07410 [Bacteroidales bacterium]|jgi:hypothetical protein
MIMNIFIEIAGWTGSFLILLAYSLISSRKLAGNSKLYQLLNVAGSLLLIANTIYHRAIPPAALNLVWLGIGIYSLVRSSGHQREGG